jgi:low affinity Fe/Cu permease
MHNSENQKHRGKVSEIFRSLAVHASAAAGSPWAFLVSLAVIVIWALSGRFFHYSDTWQLVINTGTTIITYLMVFLIQNTQNRDVRAIHIKLDEMLRGTHGPRTSFVDLEDLSDEELDKLHHEFQQIHLRRKNEKR